MSANLAASRTASRGNSSSDSEPLEPIRALLQPVGLTPSDPTLWRWVKKGRNGVKLRVVRAGRLLSRKSWVAEFVAALTENSEVPLVATPRQLETRHRRALAELDRD